MENNVKLLALINPHIYSLLRSIVPEVPQGLEKVKQETEQSLVIIEEEMSKSEVLQDGEKLTYHVMVVTRGMIRIVESASGRNFKEEEPELYAQLKRFEEQMNNE